MPPSRPSAARAQAVSPETAFVLEADDARFLTEIGMLAAGRGDVPHADAIFEALRRLRPQRAYPLVGLAVARLNAGQAEEAVRLLESVVLTDPEEHAVVRAWCGLALQLAGRSTESRKVLNEAAALPGDGGVLARQMLGQAENPSNAV